MTISVVHYNNYKDYVLARIEKMPHRGKGQLVKIARDLKVHSSLLSHIFRGPKELTLEQASDLAHYLELSALEAEYFVALVQLERAGTPTLRSLIKAHISRLRDQIGKRGLEGPGSAKPLIEQDQATFYSNWYYSGVRLLSSISQYQDFDTIADPLESPQGNHPTGS